MAVACVHSRHTSIKTTGLCAVCKCSLAVRRLKIQGRPCVNDVGGTLSNQQTNKQKNQKKTNKNKTKTKNKKQKQTNKKKRVDDDYDDNNNKKANKDDKDDDDIDMGRYRRFLQSTKLKHIDGSNTKIYTARKSGTDFCQWLA